jgi:hypothetical protein
LVLVDIVDKDEKDGLEETERNEKCPGDCINNSRIVEINDLLDSFSFKEFKVLCCS